MGARRLCIIFSLLDAKTLMLAVPQVCRFWRSVCQELDGVHLNFKPPDDPPDYLMKESNRGRRFLLKYLQESLQGGWRFQRW
jgi:hypothetical protein